jgi:hypothetical protein
VNSNQEKQQKLEVNTVTQTQSQPQEIQVEKVINQNDELLKSKVKGTSLRDSSIICFFFFFFSIHYLFFAFRTESNCTHYRLQIESISNEPFVKPKKTRNNNDIIKKQESNVQKSEVTFQKDYVVKESSQQPLSTKEKTNESLNETEKPQFIKKKTKNEKSSTTNKPKENKKDSEKIGICNLTINKTR